MIITYSHLSQIRKFKIKLNGIFASDCKECTVKYCNYQRTHFVDDAAGGLIDDISQFNLINMSM